MKNILLLILIFISYQANSQELIDSMMNMSMEDLLQVKIEVGSRGDKRFAYNSPVPVDVITALEIETCGLNELADVLQRYVPSFNAPHTSITDGSDHIRAFSLRGMGADQMLVLINGVRKPNTAMLHVNSTVLRGTTSNDLNSIPVNAIERIEILRDGAAAQYGSDAISGIINIILKSSSDQNTSVMYKQNIEGDGITYSASSSLGFKLSENDFLTVSTDVRQRGATNRSIPRTDLSGLDSVPALLGKQIYRLGDAESFDMNITYNYSHLVNESSNTCFYSFGYLNQRRGESAGFYRLPSQSRVPLSGFQNGFLPLLKPVIDDKFITVGFKTELDEWTLNSSFNFSTNSIQYNLKNSLNSSIGPTSPTDFYCGTLGFSQRLFNLNLFRTVNLGLAENLQIGIGAELRYENFVEESGDENSSLSGNYADSIFYKNQWIVRKQYPAGSQMFPGYMHENERDKSRNNVSMYADLEQSFSSKLLINLAARYENYSDFGQSLNGKLALRFEPVKNLAFRSSVSTGFRAPSLNQSYYNAISTNLVNGELIQSGTYSVENKIAQELGAKALKPELSKHFSAGIACKLINSLDFSVDYFLVKIDDRIALTGSFANSSPSEYVRNVLKKYNVEGVKYFTNGFNTFTQGLDIVIRYNIILAPQSNLMFTAVGNFNDSKISGKINVPEILPDGEDVYIDRQQISKIENGQPKHNFQFSVLYTGNKLSAQLKWIHYGEYTYVESAMEPNLDQVFKGKSIFDLSVNLKLGRKMNLQGGVYNLLNSYPDKYLPGRGDYYLVYYTEGSPFGVNGTEFYSKFTYNF